MQTTAKIYRFPDENTYFARHGKRSVPREKCWIKVVYEDASKKVHDGIIVDISDKGTRLRIQNEIEVSSHIKIYGYSKSRPKICRVAWRSDNEVGLEFIA